MHYKNFHKTNNKLLNIINKLLILKLFMIKLTTIKILITNKGITYLYSRQNIIKNLVIML